MTDQPKATAEHHTVGDEQYLCHAGEHYCPGADQTITCDFCDAVTEYGTVGTIALLHGWREVPGGWQCPKHGPDIPCDAMVAAFAPAVCGDRLTGWTCSLAPGPHPGWQHQGDGHWWSQTPGGPYSKGPAPAVPAPEPGLRALYAAAIRDAAYHCDGNCGMSERECDDAHPIQVGMWIHGVIADVNGSPDALADAVLAVRDRRLEQLRADRAKMRDDAAHLVAATAAQALKDRDRALAAEADRDRLLTLLGEAVDWIHEGELRDRICAALDGQTGDAPEHAALKRAHIALAEQAGKDQAAIARVRAECDRIEAAVRANPQDPDFDGAYLAAIGHIRAALNPQEQP